MFREQAFFVAKQVLLEARQGYLGTVSLTNDRGLQPGGRARQIHIEDSHVFELKPSGGFLGMKADECKVTYTLDTLMGGGILTNFVVGGNPGDTRRVVKAMNQLRKLVEGLPPAP